MKNEECRTLASRGPRAVASGDSSFFILPSSFALRWSVVRLQALLALYRRIRDALGSHWGRNQLALYRPWGGFMVALGGGLGGFDRLQLNSEDTKAENRVILAISAKVAFSWLFLRVFAPSVFTLYCGDKALVLSDLRR